MDNFKWTDELVKEFVKGAIKIQNQVPQDVSLDRGLYHFKKEKTKKPDWEILSFKQNSSETDLWTKFSHGWCITNNFGQPITKAYGDNEILKNTLYSIHSVKRLSDGEVFTVGDRLNGMGKDNVVIGFLIGGKKDISSGHKPTDLWLETNKEEGYGCTIDVAEKKKPKPEEPLPIKVSHFTTHDNLKGNNWDSFFYQFCSTKPIPTEKYEPIKKAIEKILSGEDWVMDFAKTMVKEMYANELLEAQKKAFLASRGIREYDTSPKNYIYPTVDDYIKSLNKQ